jgi:nicotinate-nucleotide adenylyltransferase
LAYLLDKFQQYEFSLLTGEDKLNSLPKWKNYEVILKNRAIDVYRRFNSGKIDDQFINRPKVHRIGALMVKFSSTFIRKSVENDKILFRCCLKKFGNM